MAAGGTGLFLLLFAGCAEASVPLMPRPTRTAASFLSNLFMLFSRCKAACEGLGLEGIRLLRVDCRQERKAAKISEILLPRAMNPGNSQSAADSGIDATCLCHASSGKGAKGWLLDMVGFVANSLRAGGCRNTARNEFRQLAALAT